ncbi:unnamed protein product [Amoebophrya sp. A25]|nr:unnamed protein product [Amoebophrya sp. A25]|eukprot:GSA25T00025614001.1
MCDKFKSRKINVLEVFISVSFIAPCRSFVCHSIW